MELCSSEATTESDKEYTAALTTSDFKLPVCTHPSRLPIQTRRRNQIPGSSRWEAFGCNRRVQWDHGRHRYSSPSGNVIVVFSSPELHRQQVRTRASDLWFPAVYVAGVEPAFGFLVRAMATCPSLAAALDGSALSILGVRYGDQRLVSAGHRWYMHALNLLCKELASPTDRQNWGLIGTINVLQITEAMATAATNNTSWLEHSKGLTGLLDSFVDRADPDGCRQMLSSNFRTFTVWAGLFARRRIGTFGKFSSDSALADVAERVLAALEMANGVNAKSIPSGYTNAERALGLLGVLEKELESWPGSPNSRATGAVFQNCGPANGPLTLCLKFDSIDDAMDQAICSACLLSVRRALIDVGKAIAGPQASVGSLEKAATDAADTLCTTLPYLLQDELRIYGCILVVRPLRLVTDWYQHMCPKGDPQTMEKLHWCHRVASIISQTGIRALSASAEDCVEGCGLKCG